MNESALLSPYSAQVRGRIFESVWARFRSGLDAGSRRSRSGFVATSAAISGDLGGVAWRGQPPRRRRPLARPTLDEALQRPQRPPARVPSLDGDLVLSGRAKRRQDPRAWMRSAPWDAPVARFRSRFCAKTLTWDALTCLVSCSFAPRSVESAPGCELPWIWAGLDRATLDGRVQVSPGWNCRRTRPSTRLAPTSPLARTCPGLALDLPWNSLALAGRATGLATAPTPPSKPESQCGPRPRRLFAREDPQRRGRRPAEDAPFAGASEPRPS